jgi:hypothetical protein
MNITPTSFSKNLFLKELLSIYKLDKIYQNKNLKNTEMIEITTDVFLMKEIIKNIIFNQMTIDNMIHILKIIHETKKVLQLLEDMNEYELSNLIKQTLKQLKYDGEMIELSNGFWTTTKSILITINQKQPYYMITSYPISCLADHFRNQIDIINGHKWLKLPINNEIANENFILEDSLENWLNIPKNLQNWGIDQVKFLKNRLSEKEFRNFERDSEQIWEIYQNKNQSQNTNQSITIIQNKCWAELKMSHLEKINGSAYFLARMQRIYHTKEYYFLEVNPQKMVREILLKDFDVIRFQYFIDAYPHILSSKNSTLVNTTQIDIDHKQQIIKLKNRLPYGEYRYLSVTCSSNRIDGFLMYYTFEDSDKFQEAINLLKKLQIQVN